MPKRLTQEEFIEKAKKIHGGKYDYSKVEYVNNSTKVCIICPKHGEFSIRPSDHLRGVGCSACSGVRRLTFETFTKKAHEIYGDKYDYSKVEYVNNKTKVCMVCHEKDKYGEEHGEFWQRPNDHLSGYACPKCGNEYIPTTEEWIKRAEKVHSEENFDYSKVEYKTAFSKVCIICPKHGEFWQTPNNHLNGASCPQCNTDNKSKMEEKIHILLNENNITHERQKTFEWLKNKRHLYIDFYIPKYNIGIEVQGEQHYRPIQKFGGLQSYKVQQERDKKKKALCEEHGIKLYYITKRNNNIEDILKHINNDTTE